MQKPLEKFKPKPRAPYAIRVQARRQAQGKHKWTGDPKHKPRVFIYAGPGDYTKQKYEPEEVLTQSERRKRAKAKKGKTRKLRFKKPKIELVKRGKGAQVRWTYPF